MKRIFVWLILGGALTVFVWVSHKRNTTQTNSSRGRVAPGGAVTTGTAAAGVANNSLPARPANQSPTRLATLSPAIAAAREDAPAVFLEFSRWADQFLAGDASANAARGQALAWKRREAMFELIETDPEHALALAVPFRWRQTLPASVTRFFEQRVDARGALNVAVATDFEQGKTAVLRDAQIGTNRYQAFVYGRRARQVSQPRIPLHGIALKDKLAVHTDPVRILEPGEGEAIAQARGQTPDLICGISGQSADWRGRRTGAEIGGEVRFFCGVDHARLLNQRLELAESSIATAANDQWTHGAKTVLYMRVNFPDDLTEPISEAEAYDVMDSVNDFYTASSYDLTSLTATVTPLLTLPETKAWYSTVGPGGLLDDARSTARRAGYETANYDWDIVSFTSVPDYTFGGLAYVHGKGVWLQSPGVGVTSHELGHNYGLWHANSWNVFADGSITGAGTNLEYGNIFDTMGRAAAGAYQFNATHKNVLDWLPETAVHNVTSNGVYRIYPFDSPTRQDGDFYAARITRDFQHDYWLEFRRKFTGNPWLQNGLLVGWAPWPESNGGTTLLDTTPGTPTGDNSREDAAVVIGRTYDDPAGGIHITPVARGASGTNEWIEVQINRGAFLENQPPVLQVEITPPNPAPGALVHFHATATDPEGDPLAYAWTFEDLSFSTNNLPWTFKSWAAAGDHVVRCVASDMKGGVASANALVTVGTRHGFRIRGRVADTNGVPLEGVRVENGPPNPTNYLSSFTDSDGYYLLVGTSGDLTLDAVKYGYAFTNLTWTNPISATSDVANADFVAIALPAVSLTVTTNSMPENSSVTQYFTLHRTGDTSTNLTVNLALSGSATLGSDYTLTPAWTNTPLAVDIPPGAESVSFAFKTINDLAVEGPETATITILEDTNLLYFIATLGEATITILDDDLPSRPAVSVTTLTPTVPENGMDSGAFVFSRTGGTAGDLQIFYSVSGTATPGTDYPTLLGVAIIPAGSASTTVRFRPIDDKDVELDETVIVTLSPSAAYSVSGSAAQVTILDDDLLTVTIFPTSDTAAEPNSQGRCTVKREGDLTGNLTVYYTFGGTATSGSDFVPLSGTVTIPSGAASADILLTPVDDALLEGDETVILTLATNAGYNIGTPGSATLLLRDNEKDVVSITATDDTASEPGDDFGTIRISRSSVTGSLTVYLAISGTALPGSDYLPLDNPVVIPAGANGVSLDVIAFDDLHLEPTETVIVGILPNTNYNVGSPSEAVVKILDDDANSVPAVGFTFSASSAVESESPGVSLSLSATSSTPITVNYKVIGGTASASDYILTPGPITINPGERAKAIPLQIVNDTLAEPNETIRLVIYDPVGATLDGIKVHTYTILDDDNASVSIAATVPTASETGPSAGNFRISRSGVTTTDLVVNFQVTGTASAPSDYAPLGTSATIPAGATFVDLPVTPVNDPTVEHGETVVMTLISAPGAKLVAPNVATVTITDNDPNALPLVTVTSTNHPYAIEGGGNGEFTFFRNQTTGPLTLYVSVQGTATSGADYVALPATVTIPDGQSSLALPVVPIDDALIEGDETVVLALTVRDTYRVAYPAPAIVTIQDNDQWVRLDASDFTAAEPGTDQGEFTFTRFGTTNTPVQVFYTISGTASNGLDYVAISNSFTIPAGSLSATLPIIPLDDILVEGPETVTLTLQTSSAYSLGPAISGTVTIQDDEPMLTITAPRTNIVEGGQPPGIFRITRTGDPKYSFTAHLAVGGTATYGVDYPPFLTNVYFTCGVTAIDLLISPTNELVIEPAETVTATLLPDPAYTLLSPSNAVLTIRDAGTNDTPVVIITSPTTNVVFLPGTNVGILLEASVADTGGSNSPPLVTWSKVDGPDTYVFGSTTQINTTVTFTNVGVYTLRLTADDGLLQQYAEVTAVVGPVQLLATNLLHWALDDGSGTNALDSSGAGRTGVLSGAPAWVTNGVLGGALRFNGSNDCVRLTNNFLDGLKAFSLSLWIKSAATSNDQGIFCANDSGTNATLALYSRTQASCGQSTNVIEAVIPTTRGVARHVSAANRTSNGWLHVALTWTNGLAPALFINGQLDQPLAYQVALAGALTNCPQFILGKGPPDSPRSFNGWSDDVRIFPRALSTGEIAALAGLPPANYGAVVDAGSNVTVQLFADFPLIGSVTDDGKPVPPGALSNTWSLISGPVTNALPDPHNLTNIVVFDTPGDYTFHLVGDDGQVKVFDEVTVTAIEPTRVDIAATDGEAAELGPDTGEFKLTRSGDTNVALTVFLAFSGAASNGVDFISLTNPATFEVGADTITMPVVPFLDHRIEGDELLTITIVSNLAYSIGNSPATVTIHDSPYGVWSVQHFTLEELTDPRLSSEAADFDHDGLVNFAEYACNRDPKSPETNSPVVVTIELDPNDNTNHITITYHRRLEPTDAGYAVAVSSDLRTWNTGPDYVEEFLTTDDGNNLTETVRARLVAPYTTSINQFVTVRVWLRTTGP